MNAPLLFIIFPLLVAVILWILRAYPFIVAVAATVVCLLMALLAWLFPIDSFIRVGPLLTEITSTLTVFGRRFVLEDSDRFLLIFFYTMGAFWFFGEAILQKNRSFVSLGLAIIVLAIAALSVEPFLYAALLVQIIVLISIPLLVPVGTPIGQGVMRYLVFQTLGMVLILFAGWAAGGVEANPNDTRLTAQALVFLGLGFGFWLAVFPFHTWIPSMAQESHPYQMGFMLSILPQAVLLLGLDFLNGFSWLRQYSELAGVLQFVGVIMISAGGILAAFQYKLARLIGFAVIMEIGFSLLALSLSTSSGYEIFVSMFFPRVIILLAISMAFSTIKNKTDNLEQYQGLLRVQPIETIAITAALLSLSGLPLFSVFPLRQVLLENLAQQSTQVLAWSLLGSAGFMIASLRFITTMFSPTEQKWQWLEDWRVVVLLLIGLLILILPGIMPHWFVRSMENLLLAFENLSGMP